MKHSKRLLSVMLALVMLIGVLSVGVNAALVKTEVAYDSIDNAVLTPEQVSDTLLDLLDKTVLPDIGKMDLSVLGTLDLSSINGAFSSICNVWDGFFFSVAKGLAGDIGDLNIDALVKSGSIGLFTSHTPWQRSDGDLQILYQLLTLLNTNKSIISKIAYGIGTTNGLDLGIAESFLDLGETGDQLADIPGMLRGMLFDKLLLGSYAYPTEEDVELYATAPSTIYTEWAELATKPFTNTDTLLNKAIYNLLTTPQDKNSTLVEGAMVREWDTDSIILPDVTAAQVSLSTNSFFGLIDNVLQLAYNTLATQPLNHDLKQVLLEATGVDFIEVENPSAGLLSAFAAVEATGIKNYFVNAATFKYNDIWYFSDYVTEGVDLNNDGETDLDINEAEITQKVRRFFKADMSDLKPFFELINWDYAFTTSTYNFADGLTTYGSLVGQLNHLAYVILDTVFSAQAKADIAAFLNDGQPWFIDGANSNITTNILRIAKYAVCTYADEIFGGDPDYVGEDGLVLPSFAAGVMACTSVEDLVAYIAIPIFNEVMPEIILPEEFTSGLQIEQLAALALREAISDVTPALNFDSEIFAAGTLTSSTGREFAVKSQAQWQDLILGMGLNLAMVYLDNITNINIPTATRESIYAANGWQGLLEEIVDWAVDYVGTAASGILVGVNPTALGSVRGTYNGNAFTILSTVLNKILPFGFLCDCVDASGNLDVNDLFWTVYNAIVNLDVNALLGLLGRSGLASNIFSAGNIVSQILTVLNKILGVVFNDTTILQTTANLDTALNQANLKLTIQDLFAALYTRRVDLLTNILPLIAQFVSDWGGEQVIGSPDVSLDTTVIGTNGAVTDSTFTIGNGAKGVWRGYMDGSTRLQDNQYKVQITSVTCTTTAGTVSNIRLSTTAALDYGQSLTVTYNAASVPAAGSVAKFNIKYKVYDEDNNAMANGKIFETNRSCYISYNKTDAGTRVQLSSKKTFMGGTCYLYILTPLYAPFDEGIEYLPSMSTYHIFADYSSGEASGQITSTSPNPQKGVTLNVLARSYVDSDTQHADYQCFTVNSATYGGITAGETMTWTVKGKAYEKNGSADSERTGYLTLKYYSAEFLGEVKSLAGREINNDRKLAEYNTGDCFADRILITAANATEENPQETNFTTTGVNEDGDTVTVVNGTTAWANYVTALNNAIRAAYQVWNANSVYTQEACYNALRIAAIDVQVCKKTAYEMAQSGGENNDSAVEALILSKAAIDDSIGGYKDYMLYRWNRLEDWRNSVNSLETVYEASKADIDSTYFPYIKIDVDDLSALLTGDTNKPFIEALLEPLTAEEILAASNAKDNAIKKYASDYDALEINQMANMITRTSARLLPREGGDVAGFGYVKTYLNTEIASALAVLGNAATSTLYTEKSWNKYLNALAEAQTQAATGTANAEIFDAKYYLQKAVNALIPIEDDADYSGLEDAIASAQLALANLNLYEDDLRGVGEVIAALGYEVDDIDLFPGAALNVVETPYDFEDQDKIDNAEIALRLALANLRYIGTTLTGATPDATTELQGTGNDSYYAYVPKNLVMAAVHGYLSLVNPPIDVTDIQPVLITEGKAYAGTGTIVTYYGKKTVGLDVISVPVASYSVVVKGDVSGDAAIDSADALLADLVVGGHKEVEGAFLKAALADPATAGGGVVTIEALSAILNIAVGK